LMVPADARLWNCRFTRLAGGRPTVRMALEDVRAYYQGANLVFYPWMEPGRKHYRIEVGSGRFLKLNQFKNRIRPEKLQRFLVKYTPIHAYMSVLSWLFPERVAGRQKANRAYPLNGTFLLDVDVKTNRFHNHALNRRGVCEGCLRLARFNTLNACSIVEENYREYLVVFSGRKGFHILLPFSAEDWTHYRVTDPLKTQAAARFKYALYLRHRGVWFDFKTSVDPLRVHSVPSSLNAETGLTVKPIGERADLEALSIGRILDLANPTRFIHPPEFAPVKVTLKPTLG